MCGQFFFEPQVCVREEISVGSHLLKPKAFLGSRCMSTSVVTGRWDSRVLALRLLSLAKRWCSTSILFFLADFNFTLHNSMDETSFLFDWISLSFDNLSLSLSLSLSPYVHVSPSSGESCLLGDVMAVI